MHNSLGAAKDNVVYRFKDEYGCNYIFLKIPNAKKYFYVGPYLTEMLMEANLKLIFQRLSPPTELFQQIVAYYNNLPIVEDENMLFGIVNCLASTLWGSTENFSMEYVEYPIPDFNPPISLWNHTTQHSHPNFTLSSIEEHYKNEGILMQAVAKGELHKLTALTSDAFSNGIEERINDSLPNRKNYLIILNTILRKSAEMGGVPPFQIHVFSSNYAKKIESVYSINESLKPQTEMIREYCILVRNKSIKNYSQHVGEAITLISYDLTADLSLKNIAKTLNLNPSYLSSIFSKECGCTLTEYIHNQRLEEGMRQLLHTNKTVLQISTECGFTDAHYFIRCFKKKNGLTPLEYRKNNLS